MVSLAITDPIFNQSAGLLSELEKKISPQEVRRLERLGYIENAVSPKGETWKLSKKGRQSRDILMQKYSWKDRITDFFYRHVLHYRVSI